jgi:hypothetical protein
LSGVVLLMILIIATMIRQAQFPRLKPGDNADLKESQWQMIQMRAYTPNHQAVQVT